MAEQSRALEEAVRKPGEEVKEKAVVVSSQVVKVSGLVVGVSAQVGEESGLVVAVIV